jgi:hypothetical protein
LSEELFIKTVRVALTLPLVVVVDISDESRGLECKGNLTNLRRELHLSLAKGNPKRTF